MPADAEGAATKFQDAFGERRQHRRIPHALDYNGELIPRQPRQQVAIAHGSLETLRRGLQQPVADRMSKRVVDRLEAVEVEHEQRDLPAVPPRLVEAARHELLEVLPIRQAG